MKLSYDSVLQLDLMMSASDLKWQQLFAELVTKPVQIALVCTGGGSGAIAKCFRRVGASKNFVEAAIPYSRIASEAYLGSAPEGPYASKVFAQQLASAAFGRATSMSDIDSPVSVGIALVAALPSNRPDDVDQRIHVAICRQDEKKCWSETLAKGTQTRESAEAIADEMVFRAIEYVVRM